MGIAGEFSRWAAHEAAASVTAPVVGAAARGYLYARDTRDHARNAYTATRALRDDGMRGARMVSAGEWFHGMSDRRAALGQLSADFAAFQGDLSLHAESPADIAWTIAVVVPTLRDFQAFHDKQAASGLSPWVTEWSVYESWQERLQRLRDLARSRGVQLDSPEPVPLPKTIWQRGADGTGGSLDTWFGLAKAAILGVIGLTGVVGLYVVARDLHHKAQR